MTTRLVHFSVSHPKVIWGLSFLLLLTSILFATRIQQDGRIEALIHPNNPTILLRNEMEKHFGSSTFILLGTHIEEWDQESLAEAQELALNLSRIDNVKEVHSLFNKNYLESSDDGFSSYPIVSKSETGQFNIDEILTHLASDPIYNGNLVGLGAQAIPLLVEFNLGTSDQKATESVESVVAELKPKLTWSISGLPVIQHEMKRFMDRDMGVLVPLFVIAVLIFLYLSFRSWVGVLVPLAAIVMSVVSTYGLMGAIGIKITMVTNLVPMLLIAIGAASSIHFMTQYFRDGSNSEYGDSKALVNASGRHIGKIIFLASATTILGFLSNIFNPVTAIRDFAIALAFGVSIIFFMNLTLVPSILSCLKKPSPTKSGVSIGRLNSAIDLFLYNLYKLVIHRYKSIVVLGLGLSFFCFFGIFQLKVESSGLSFFKDQSKLVTESRALSKDFGGVVSFDISVDSLASDGLKNAQILNTLNQFTKWLKETYPEHIQVTLTLSDYVSQMAKAYNNTGEETFEFTNHDEIYQYLEVYSWKASLEEDLRNIVDDDFRFARLTGRFSLIENPDGSYRESSLQEQKEIILNAQAWLESRLPKEFEVEPFGEMMIATEVNDSIIQGQITSLLLASISVLFIVALFFRSLKYGFLSLVPVLIAIGVNFGVMGVLGIPLNIATALVSTMAIGIGIDDAIHFVTSYKHHTSNESDRTIAISNTFQGAGRAIIYTTIALASGFLIMLASQFTPVVYFGFLNIVTISFATLSTLLVLPALLFWLDKQSAVHAKHQTFVKQSTTIGENS